MPDVIRHPEVGGSEAWIPAFAGMTVGTGWLYGIVKRSSPGKTLRVQKLKNTASDCVVIQYLRMHSLTVTFSHFYQGVLKCHG